MGSLSTVLQIAASVVLSALIIIAILYFRFPLHLIFKSKSGFQDMLDGITDPIAALSKDYEITRANKAYIQFTHSSFDRIIGQKCYSILRHRDSPCEDCTLQKALADHNDSSIPRSSHPSGKGAISIHFAPYFTSYTDGRPFIIEHIRDISLLESLKIDLEEKNESLTNTMKHLKDARLKLKEELRLAKLIQQGTLPETAPEFEGLKINSVYHPVTEVGGDFYDFIRFSPTRIGIFIGDASGHGLAAAFIATISKMSLYNNSKSEIPPNELLSNINRDLLNIVHTNHYLTCFWGIIDTTANTMTYSRAGHPFPIIVKRSGLVMPLNVAGPFIGIMEKAVFNVNSVSLQKNDRLFIFTDGIYDVFDRNDPSQNRFGYDRFVEILASTSYLPFGKLISSIQHTLSDYSYSDDYTLIAIEFLNSVNNLGN